MKSSIEVLKREVRYNWENRRADLPYFRYETRNICNAIRELRQIEI